MILTQTNTNKPSHDTEQLRLAAIENLDILDTPPDGKFDRLTRLAGRIFGVPIAIVTVVDSDRIWFKSKLGLDVCEIGKEPGLCASCILQDEVMVISDAKKDAVALTNPLVAGEFGLRFYAGAPLKTSEGHNIGTFCIIDREPREFSDAQQATLADLAAIVVDHMELRLASRKLLLKNIGVVEEAEKKALTDSLTGVGNRRAFDNDIAEFEQLIKLGSYSDLIVTMVDLDGLKLINDEYGHKGGDRLIQSFGSSLRSVMRNNDGIYRVGGDEFVIFSPISSEKDSTKEIRNRIVSVVNDVRKKTGFQQADASVGIIALSASEFDIQKALRLADKRMYEEKIKRPLSRD